MEAFGEEATQARRELMVLAKGISTRALKVAHSQKEQLLKDLQKETTAGITKVIPRMPPHAQYSSMLLGYSDLAAAQKLCRDGLL